MPASGETTLDAVPCTRCAPDLLAVGAGERNNQMTAAGPHRQWDM